MQTLILATGAGLVVAEPRGTDWQPSHTGLQDRRVTSAIARDRVILAGTRDGIFQSDDDGQTWHEASSGLSTQHVRWMAFHPDIADLEFAGTEPAGIFISQDGGENWRARPEVEALRDANRWWLPYSPEAGCVRGFAFHGTRAYAAVEVGGLLRSDDHGRSWRLAGGSTGKPVFSQPSPGFIHPDVHSVQVHPISPDLVFAPTNSGLYRSSDGGETWERISRPSYCRAVWLDAADPQHLILGPADAVGRGGRLEETLDGGQTWHSVAHGVDTPWPRAMAERFVQVGEQLLAVLSNGELYATVLATLGWRRILSEIDTVAAVAPLDP
jgi:photosystem II stability/assembly factor-like uncharacterized protein